MTALEKLRKQRGQIMVAAKRHGVSNIRVFGSCARGDDDEKSDIDLLVDLDSGRSLFDLGGLLTDLEELLESHVDVVTENALRGRIRERVLADAKRL